MTRRRQLDVSKRPLDSELYQALLQSAASLATVIGLIVRSDKVALTPHAVGLLRALAPYLIRTERVAEWPGTRLVGGRTSLHYLYRLTPESLAAISAAADDMFAWVNPELPEDIHFLRTDGTTVLGSIAQEDAVWLELDEDELHEMLTSAPAILKFALAQ
jgi:hypothetical protein